MAKTSAVNDIKTFDRCPLDYTRVKSYLWPDVDLYFEIASTSTESGNQHLLTTLNQYYHILLLLTTQKVWRHQCTWHF